MAKSSVGDFFYEYYRPLEEQELSEIWAEQEHYKPDYPAAVGGHTNMILKTFGTADRHRQALTSKYCVCPDVSQFTKTGLMLSTVYGDSDNFARRYAEQIAQEKNDIRWARRIAAASRGRNLLATSASFASKAAGFFSDYASAMKGVATSASQFSGYIRNRFQTDFNPVRQRIDARGDVPNTYRGFDQQSYWQNATIYEPTARGGISWGQAEGASPYMQSGFDPAGYAMGAPRT